MPFPNLDLASQPKAVLLRCARFVMGVPLSELAARTGYSISYLSQVERGRKPLSPRVSAALAKAFSALSTEARS